jgi:hypothetical protein
MAALRLRQHRRHRPAVVNPHRDVGRCQGSSDAAAMCGLASWNGRTGQLYTVPFGGSTSSHTLKSSSGRRRNRRARPVVNPTQIRNADMRHGIGAVALSCRAAETLVTRTPPPSPAGSDHPERPTNLAPRRLKAALSDRTPAMGRVVPRGCSSRLNFFDFGLLARDVAIRNAVRKTPSATSGRGFGVAAT